MDYDLGTWNVRTLNKVGALRCLLNELQKYKIKIAAIQETKWNDGGNSISEMKTHIILSSGKSEGSRESGVAFIIDKSLKSQILDFKPISSRICILRVKTKFHNLSITNVHAPTEDKSDEAKDEFYQNLASALALVPSNDIKVVIGDFNAKVGKEKHFSGTIGKHSLHDVSSDNGIRLIDFASSNSMVISSTFFPHKNIHKWTWSSPDGRTHNQIDHVLIEKRGATHILDVRTWRGACCDSDHYLVRIRYRTRISIQQPGRAENIEKFNLDKLKDRRYQQSYEYYCNKVINVDDLLKTNINAAWEHLKTNMKEAAKETIDIASKARRNDWFDEECKQAVEMRNQLYKEYIARPTRSKHERYNEARRKCNKLCRKKKRELQNLQILKIQEDFENADVRKAYQQINLIRRGYQPRINMCKDKNGNLLFDVEKVKERWKEYFQALLNPITQANMGENIEIINEEDKTQVEPPSFTEVTNVVRRQKNNKAPGKDGITVELFKCGGESVLRALHNIIMKIWEEENIPEEWKTAIICPVYKKGHKLDCENYRGISLLCTAYKIFTTILKDRLEPIAEEILGEYQAGFRRSRSTTDQIFTLKQLLEKGWEKNIDIYQIFVDFKQAYDSIDRERLIKILLEFGVPSKLVRLIKLTVTDTRAQVKIQKLFTDQFQITKGLRQGDSLAPMLFNLALEWVIRKLQVQRNATLLNKSVQIIGYADDLNIVGRSIRVVKECYAQLKDAAKQISLNINESKTKVMLQTRTKTRELRDSLTIDDHNLEVVNSFKYLGTMITNKNEELIEVQTRILQANKAFMSQRKILKSNSVHRKTKFRLYKTLIRPVISYGSESWTLTQKTESMLDTFERKVLRYIMGPVCEDRQWRIRYNLELYQVYDDPPLSTFIKLNRLRWAGHVARMTETSIPRRMLDAGMEGNRLPGRPRKRWLEAVNDDASSLLNIKNWRTASRNRHTWRQSLQEAKARFGL